MIILFLNNICCVIITVSCKLHSNSTLLIFVENLILLDNLIVCAINLICFGVLDAVRVVCVVLVWWAWMVAVWWRGWMSEWYYSTRVLLAHPPLLLNCGH